MKRDAKTALGSRVTLHHEQSPLRAQAVIESEINSFRDARRTQPGSEAACVDAWKHAGHEAQSHVDDGDDSCVLSKPGICRHLPHQPGAHNGKQTTHNAVSTRPLCARVDQPETERCRMKFASFTVLRLHQPPHKPLAHLLRRVSRRQALVA
jgi:hypothetical protein